MAPFIFVPLYIYPIPGAWDPLSDALASNPDLTFKVVVNPSNGPGPQPVDKHYQLSLSQLSKYPNVDILGYVHVSWGRKPSADVTRDIDTYQSWINHPLCPVAIKGIFYDEWPSDTSLLLEMRGLVDYARERFGSTPISIVCNPGTVVDEIWYDVADHIVAYENTENMWDTMKGGVVASLESDIQRRSVVVVHSADNCSTQLFLSNGFGGVFWTSSHDYSSWCDYWGRFVAEVSKLQATHSHNKCFVILSEPIFANENASS